MRQRGLAVVELALVLPIFVMLLMGTAEIGRALYKYNALNKMVRTGAQYLAKNAVEQTGFFVDITDPVYTSAKNLVVYGKPTVDTSVDPPLLSGMTVANVTVTPITVTGASGPTYVQVSATYTYSKIFTLIPTFGNGTITSPGTMTASVTMVGL